ncbi:MAG: hypothetical protein ACU836_10070 [Gammaproteobacteria bacterium]
MNNRNTFISVVFGLVIAIIGLDALAQARVGEVGRRPIDKTHGQWHDPQKREKIRQALMGKKNFDNQQPIFNTEFKKFTLGDLKVRTALPTESANEKLRSIQDASNNQFVAINLEMLSPNLTWLGLYSVTVGDRDPVFFNTPAEISAYINQVAKEKMVTDVFLFVSSGRLEKDFDALRTSLAAQQNQLEPNVTAKFITPSDDIYRTFFQAGARVLIPTPNQILTDKGKFRTWITAHLESGTQTTVNFYSKSKEVLIAFWNAFYNLLGKRDLRHVSVAAIAIEARKEIMTSLGVDSDDDVIIEVEDQMKNVQVVSVDPIPAALN